MEENIMENIDCKYFGNLASFLGNPVFSQFSDHTAQKNSIRFRALLSDNKEYKAPFRIRNY